MPKVKTHKRSLNNSPISRKTKEISEKSKETTTKALTKQKSTTLVSDHVSVSNIKPSLAVLNLIKSVKARYSTAENKTQADGMKKYMRNQFEFLGIRTPDRRSLNTEIFECHPVLSHVDMFKMFYLMWEEPEREYQLFVLDYYDKYIKYIDNPKYNDDNLLVLRHLITTKSWWDTVDLLASKDVGRIVLSDVDKYSQVMDEWIEDENMWLRRSAILHQLNYKCKTDTDRLFRYCLKCAHEQDFFIRKSIGWALRNHFRFEPGIIKQFVEKNEDKLSNLSKKEALKHA